MREKLTEYINSHGMFSGTVTDFGIKKYPMEETVLLLQVRDYKGNSVSDHIWISLTKDLKRICPCYGDRISFEAYVETYKSKHGDNLGFTRIQNVRVAYQHRKSSVVA